MAQYDLHKKAASVVRDAGGELVGRTRLQKVTYLMQLAGFSADFPFEYKHYGPYSEELASAMEIATGLKIVAEEEKRTEWGGWYSIYKFNQKETGSTEIHSDADRINFLKAASRISAIDLELAATAAFLYDKEGFTPEGKGDPWAETARRKPEKAGDGRLDRAKVAYRQLAGMNTPSPLPGIV
jgi:uncharacterized protein